MPRVVVDANVIISAAISPAGSTVNDLVDLLVQGRAIPLVSPQLVAEVTSVLERPKFRRWLTLQDAHDYVDAIVSLAERVDDPDPAPWQGACRDPKDDYLVALAEAHGAAVLVSGDQDVLALERGGLVVRSPAAAVQMLRYEHPWGSAVLPADIDDMWRAADTRGDTPLLLVSVALLTVLDDEAARGRDLAALVVPETATAWRRDLDTIKDVVRDRGVASFARRISPDVAHIALPQDPGPVGIRATADQLVDDALWLTLVRTEHNDPPQADGWRAFAIGGRPLTLEDLPPPWGDSTT